MWPWPGSSALPSPPKRLLVLPFSSNRASLLDNLLDGSLVLLGEMGISSRVSGKKWEAAYVSERKRQLSALFNAHYSELRGLAFVILGDQHYAEEVVMDAFTKVFSSWTDVSKLDWPYGYLRRVVVNLCRDRIRRSRLETRINASHP